MELPRHVVETAAEWQRKIHRHPELGYKETETSEKIGDYLRALGWDVTSRLAGTGVLAVKKGDGEVPRLLLRAELDALPIQEETGLPYASNTPGVSHACGHDGHLATLLGVAAGLAEADFRHGDVGLRLPSAPSFRRR